jgi:hypothetical protein
MKWMTQPVRRFFRSLSSQGSKTPATRKRAHLTLESLEDRQVMSAMLGTFHDSDGDIYQVKITGPGSGTVVQNDPLGIGAGPISQIVLQGTNAKSQVQIIVKPAPGGDGRVDIGDIQGPSGLKAFAAKTCNLVGDMDLGGLVGTLALASTQGESSIHASGIGNFTIAGDCEGDLKLDGTGNPRQATLNKGTIGGYLTGNWHITGTVANVLAKSNVDGFVFSADYLKSFQANGVFEGSHLYASQIDKVKLVEVNGNNNGDIFGVAGVKVGRVDVVRPSFRYISFNPASQGTGDFVVRAGQAARQFYTGVDAQGRAANILVTAFGDVYAQNTYGSQAMGYFPESRVGIKHWFPGLDGFGAGKTNQVILNNKNAYVFINGAWLQTAHFDNGVDVQGRPATVLVTTSGDIYARNALGSVLMGNERALANGGGVKQWFIGVNRYGEIANEVILNNGSTYANKIDSTWESPDSANVPVDQFFAGVDLQGQPATMVVHLSGDIYARNGSSNQSLGNMPALVNNVVSKCIDGGVNASGQREIKVTLNNGTVYTYSNGEWH